MVPGDGERLRREFPGSHWGVVLKLRLCSPRLAKSPKIQAPEREAPWRQGISDGLGSSHTEQVGLIYCDSYKDRQKQKGERSYQETPGEDSHLHHGTEAWDSVPLTALRQAIPEDSFILRFF